MEKGEGGSVDDFHDSCYSTSSQLNSKGHCSKESQIRNKPIFMKFKNTYLLLVRTNETYKNLNIFPMEFKNTITFAYMN